MGSYKTFKDFFKDKIDNGELIVKEDIETVDEKDENIANNRLFVWNFEKKHLSAFMNVFERYNSKSTNFSSRQVLQSDIRWIVNDMIRSGYNPVECLLYASKLINMKLQNDRSLKNIIAEEIRDIYKRQKDETIKVIEHIIDMWTWTPQIKIVISSIGYIGDNEQLFDKILTTYGEDDIYKLEVFYALFDNKTPENLERCLKIIISLKEYVKEDNIIAKRFIEGIDSLGNSVIELVRKYSNIPGVSKYGKKVLHKVMLKYDDNLYFQENDQMYLKQLAKRSISDDDAYFEFLNYCKKHYKAKNSNNLFYFSRFANFSIAEDFLIKVLQENKISNQHIRNTAIISLGNLGSKGLETDILSTLRGLESDPNNEYAVLVSYILMYNKLRDNSYIERLVDIFSTNKEYELGELYLVLKNADIAKNPLLLPHVQLALEDKFYELVHKRNYGSLELLTLNLQFFYSQRLYSFISEDLHAMINDFLKNYVEENNNIKSDIIINLINVIACNWNQNVEKIMFMLYRSQDIKVQQAALKKLQERDIQPPK